MNNMWNQFFALRHDKPRTLQLQIRQQLINAITEGLIRPNDSLPSSRILAKDLNVARNTIIAAYKELEFDGYITAKERQGYFVNKKLYANYSKTNKNDFSDSNSPEWIDRLITKKPSTKINIKKSEDCQRLPYSFTVGQLDQTLIPFYEWREVVRHSSTVPEIKNGTLIM